MNTTICLPFIVKTKSFAKVRNSSQKLKLGLAPVSKLSKSRNVCLTNECNESYYIYNI